MYVKPAPGIALRDPVTKRLISSEPIDGIETELVPSRGMKVDDNDMYWIRRIRDGDAVQVPQTATSAPVATQQKTES
ncbi:DUF2635 domain-containing protein [Burkholderia vietnamiensis]|uniref:DUF2635 domain-containing protein n=1 Tax=Burkholderia vietnamiensis TaxID=60552 RepID=UPI00104191E8|nr:DUF2635 domain-containing protein [Burkholderia vietnamiensis]HDR9026952.1 DUF2635 domain-containing protein [Burkholderia vietnamiensis]